MLDDSLQKVLIKTGCEFTRGYVENDPYMKDFESDQDFTGPSLRWSSPQ